MAPLLRPTDVYTLCAALGEPGAVGSKGGERSREENGGGNRTVDEKAAGRAVPSRVRLRAVRARSLVAISGWEGNHVGKKNFDGYLVSHRPMHGPALF